MGRFENESFPSSRGRFVCERGPEEEAAAVDEAAVVEDLVSLATDFFFVTLSFLPFLCSCSAMKLRSRVWTVDVDIDIDIVLVVTPCGL